MVVGRRRSGGACGDRAVRGTGLVHADRVSPLEEDTMRRPHPFLRAYMAGIVVPTMFLLVIMAVFGYHRYYFEVPNQFVIPLPGRPLERALIFPMAVVPNLWG